MDRITKIVKEEDYALLSMRERVWIEGVITKYSGFPNISEIWSLMDTVWRDLGCKANKLDYRIPEFYSHPVWILNGLFIEQHELSILHRQNFVDQIVIERPKRIADFGGGFGGLARMIGKACPDASIEVIEPHAHPLAVSLALKTHNVIYKNALAGEYDLIIATDVFEHVSDPLLLAYQTALNLKNDGCYIFANCFFPIIQCHLPQTFHFRYTWPYAMSAMGLIPGKNIAYGQIFKKQSALNLNSARQIELKSKKLWWATKYFPGRLAVPLNSFLFRL